MQHPQNPLEISLARAAAEPASRPEFYSLLLESEIYVIGQTDTPGDGRTTIQAGAKLSIANFEKNDGTPFIPFFSSVEALQRTLSEESRFVGMPARDLFEITRGATLILNPGSDYGKEFFPDEIDALLATGVNHVATERVVQKATKVLLGQPANYPSEMISSVTKLLAKHSGIKAAYLCLMHDPASMSAPSLVIGFEGNGDFKTAMREAGSVAADTAPRGTPVDFVEIKRGTGGVSDYLIESVKPFYERTWGSRLRSMLSPARA
ncbi:enhanced serine sensitivity protein SseB C-terminal domain-containing protein [Thermomonas sp.]|uniref:enhanced serine sensitivity protein SseB C-terminal domain-containing protein n=1 Tax=Thermomonas sp. TaxID=1971895 RepID=UPI00257D546C|nr:enhanced serine sensitivity protein SseB C-terminal domain-containing protein [Thermomonas sp.]